MLKFYRIILYLFTILVPLFLISCQGWLSPNVGAL